MIRGIFEVGGIGGTVCCFDLICALFGGGGLGEAWFLDGRCVGVDGEKGEEESDKVFGEHRWVRCLAECR